ncbi:MAG: hypothetical protein V9G19_06640 [Tetrasphaera sp.]
MTRAPGVTGLAGAAAVELDYLRRHLRRAHGFSLALVVSNHEALTRAVARDIVADGGVVVDLDADGPGPVAQLEQALSGRTASRVVLLGLGRLLDDPRSPALGPPDLGCHGVIEM